MIATHSATATIQALLTMLSRRPFSLKTSWYDSILNIVPSKIVDQQVGCACVRFNERADVNAGNQELL
jgi:hypothetical protein